jgi:hypothetical protein
MASDPNSIYPLGSQRTLPTATEDRFARANRLAKEQERALESRRLQDTPDDIKRRTAAARELGLKPSEVLDLSWAEKAVKAKRQMAEREKYPALARFFDKHPDMAALQLDSTEELSGLATTWDALKKAPGRLGVAGGLRAAEMATSSLAYSLSQFRNVAAGEPGSMGASGITSAEEYARRAPNGVVSGALLTGEKYLEAQADLASKRYGSSNYVAEGLLAGLESVPLTIAALGLTVATRNPGVGAGAIGGLVGLDSAREAQKKGLGDGGAALYGVLQGVPEAAFELLPMEQLLKIGGKGALKAFGKYMLTEGLTETGTTITQSFVDWAMLPENKNRTIGDWATGLPDEIGKTLLGVAGGGSVTVTTAQGFAAAGQFARRRAAQREMAAFGRFEGDWLDMMGNAANAATMRAEDPERFAELMRDMASERGVSTVLVSGDAVRGYLQSSDFQGENDPLAAYAQAAEDAALAGNDIAIPIETALTTLPGSKAWEALKDDMRLTAGGMSKRQAEALEASEEAMLEEFRKQAEATDSSARKQTASREDRIAKITTKLEEDGGFAPAEAARQAELLVARMSTRAARMGRDDAAVDQAVENLRIRQVMPPELQRAMAAQEQDMVVAILRGNTNGSTSRARAAAAELQAVLKRQGWTPEQLSDEQLGQVIERMRAAGENDGREYREDGQRTGDRGTGDRGRAAQALDGAPQVEGATGPDLELARVAEEYARANGIDYGRQAEYAAVNVEFATRLADAYEAMAHAPDDPAVAEAYADLIAQTTAQYEALVAAGYVFTFFDETTDPYEGNPWNAMRDLRANKRMAVFATRPLTEDAEGQSFGSSDFDATGNPLLALTEYQWADQNGTMHPVTANDLFRAVHDAFGHGLEGAGFRARGEENAWQAHARLFTGPALAALTTETRGQNSWLNFGPFGEANRNASVEETTFADQKTGLLPEWAWTENVVPAMEPTDGRLDEALIDGESAAVAAGGIQVGWTAERIDDLLRTHGYASDPEKSKALAGRLTPEQFLGLTASAKGRRLITERVEGMEQYGDGIDFEQMRGNPQAPFLIVVVEGGFTSRYLDDEGNPAEREIPVSLRVMGHEGRHRMTMLARAGVTSIPVVIIVQEARGKEVPTSAELGPQRSRSDQVANGDQVADIEGLIPISYANRERLVAEFGQGRELFQVSPEQALDLNVPVEMPTDPKFAEAVANTPEAEITPDGLRLTTVRKQLRKQEGARSVRSGVFYLPKGSPNLKHYGGKNGYGGTEKFEAETLIRRPMFVKGATGGKAPEAAFTALRGKDAFKELEDRIFKAISGKTLMGVQPDDVAYVIERFSGVEISSGEAREIIWNSRQGNQLRYAIQERIVAEVVRAEGYDAIIGYGQGRGGKGAFISEVFDVREQTYPARGMDSEIHSRYFEQATIFYSALERAAQAVKTERAPAQQWIATLKNAPGVKAEELEWTGIIDWLEAQTGMVDKAQVVETIQRGGIVVR